MLGRAVSDKQKRASLQARRKARRDALASAQARRDRQRRDEELKTALSHGELLVEPSRLSIGYSVSSEFLLRGTYRAIQFTCRGCGKVEEWTPAQQKWWYEIAKGDLN